MTAMVKKKKRKENVEQEKKEPGLLVGARNINAVFFLASFI